MFEKTGLAQAVGHMLTSCRVAIALQIPECRFFAARWQGVDIGQRRPDFFMTPELGIARDQDEEAVGVRPDVASRQRSLDRLFVTPQMIKTRALLASQVEARGSRGLSRHPVSIASRASS